MSRFRYDPDSWRTEKTHYTIDEHHVVHGPFAFDDWLEWAITVEDFPTYSHLCIVGRTRIDMEDGGDCQVMTDFLRGINCSMRPGKEPPLLFETMVFGGELDQHIERYSTWAEAEAGHRAMVDMVMQRSEASDTH